MLPKRDRKAAKAVAGPPRTAQHGKLYKPGSPMSLDTGKEHKLETGEGPSYWLHLPLNRRDANLVDDKFILRSKDGKYEVARTVRDDQRPGGVGLLLEFPDLRRSQAYTLIHDQGAEGVVSELFVDLPFESIFQPNRRRSPSRIRRRKQTPNSPLRSCSPSLPRPEAVEEDGVRGRAAVFSNANGRNPCIGCRRWGQRGGLLTATTSIATQHWLPTVESRYSTWSTSRRAGRWISSAGRHAPSA